MDHCIYRRVILALFYTYFHVVHGIIISSCKQTPYPQVCHDYNFLNHKHHSTLDDVHDQEITSLSFRDTALRAAAEQAAEAHRLVAAVDANAFGERGKSAWRDCLELYEENVDLLERATKNNDHVDTHTWLSATMANHQTCRNGFAEFGLGSHFESSFPPMLSNFSKLLSNSLAVHKASSETPPLPPQVHGRRRRSLLSLSFPDWVSAADRRLLQTAGAAAARADIVVAQDGSGDHGTISEAVEAAAKLGGRTVIVYVKAGVYKENVEIKRGVKNLMMVGDGKEATIVTGDRNNQDGSTTFRSATFAVAGDGFVAQDMTFENTAGPENHQAVALRSSSDRSVFYRCSFKGYQDTLYVHSNRQFYRDCDIYGTVDFIFGDAAAVFQHCNILIRRPSGGQKNTVTAQGRSDPNENTGFVIHASTIAAASDLRPVLGNVESYLGRPWQKYSRTVVMKSAIDASIDHKGWLPWSGGFALSTLYYAEFMNSGTGAGTSGRVNWPGYRVLSSASEAGKYTVANFLAGGSWIPATKVPYDEGL